MEINFDELASLQQANTRASQYEFKRSGKDKFILSNKGKTVIGYDETKGWEVKHGNGVVVIAVRPKDDSRVKIIRGIKGSNITSNILEEVIVKHLGEDTKKCTFENAGEYDGATWYKIVPVTISATEVETNEDNDSSEAENDSSDQESTNEENAEEQIADESTENENINKDDEF